MRNLLVLGIIWLALAPALLAQESFKNYYDNGNILSEGRFNSAGLPEGDWKYYYSNGQAQREGTYRNGHPIGTWKEWYENGQMKASLNFLLSGSETVKNGPYTMYHPNGKLAVKGNYAYGRKTGKWLKYDEEGKLILEDAEINKATAGK
jgi:antitoxin component YwqK of YwqJK toxin-antitoxin module